MKKTGELWKDKGIATVVIVVIILILLVLFGVDTHGKKENSSTVSNKTSSTKPAEISKPTKTQIICLDPGHGGKDTGAVYKKIYESNVNLIVAKVIKTTLESDGYQVFMTRDDDSFVYKRDRARYCNSVKASVMVSIHHNSYETDTSTDYATALYYKSSDVALASSILGAVSDEMKMRDQGIAKFDNSMLYIATMPAMMSEAFFITSSKEYGQISQSDSARLKSEGSAISTGIKNYFANPKATADNVDVNSLIIDRSDYGD